MINRAAKRYFITVGLLFDGRNFIDIPTEKCFKLAQKPCGRVSKRKYNLNGINAALRRHFR